MAPVSLPVTRGKASGAKTISLLTLIFADDADPKAAHEGFLCLRHGRVPMLTIQGRSVRAIKDVTVDGYGLRADSWEWHGPDVLVGIAFSSNKNADRGTFTAWEKA